LNHCAVHFFFRYWGIPHYRAWIFLLFPFIFEQQQTHYYVRVDRAGLDIRLLRNWRNKLDGPYTLDLFSSPSILGFTNLDAPWLVGWLVQRCSLPVGLGFTLSMSVWISDRGDWSKTGRFSFAPYISPTNHLISLKFFFMYSLL
jgi:hypothetical protein